MTRPHTFSLTLYPLKKSHDYNKLEILEKFYTLAASFCKMPYFEAIRDLSQILNEFRSVTSKDFSYPAKDLIRMLDKVVQLEPQQTGPKYSSARLILELVLKISLSEPADA